MSAVEALAEVLREHQWCDFHEARESAWNRGEDGPEDVCRCGWRPEDEYVFDHEDHQISALVAAIRSMPAEQVAELIGGETEKKAMAWHKGVGLIDWHRRVVTPWLPLGVSPETNGEQK